MLPAHIAVLNSHPIQYFAPLYAYLNRDPALCVTALYLSNTSIRGATDKGFGRPVRWDIDLLEGYPSLFLGKSFDTNVPGGFFSLAAPEIWNELRSGRYDMLWLNGHNYLANFIALAAAKTFGMPVLMRSETNLGLRRSSARAFFRQPIMRSLYKTCDAFLAIGTANAKFYRAMGVPDRKVFLVPYAVDNQRFMAAARRSTNERSAVRKKLKMDPELPAVIYASKFQKRKRPETLVAAAAKLKQEGLRFQLVFVGSGEMEEELKNLAGSLGLAEIVFPGFVNQAELPSVFSACDIFVLASENEPWGLVVNEAMCAGLPVIVSDEVGCAPDLVKNGVNGFVIPAGNTRALAEALRPLLLDSGLRQRMSEAALRQIADWSYAQCMDGIKSAVEFVRKGAGGLGVSAFGPRS